MVIAARYSVIEAVENTGMARVVLLNFEFALDPICEVNLLMTFRMCNPSRLVVQALIQARHDPA
jgi:hypothetical protein